MPRTYHRKTERQSWDPQSMQQALDAIKNGMPIRSAAKSFNVPVMSLKRRTKNKNLMATENIKHLGSKKPVFSPEQEDELIQHILDLEIRMYGITTQDLRRLAFQLAEKNNIKHNFNRNKMAAGKDWLYGFQKRHPEITLRSPESTSAARARAFNKPVVMKFFSLLKDITQQYNYPPHRVFNVDETSLSTVPGKNSKTFAKKGRKQVARVISAERGISTTAVICMSAAGSFIPPMLIFCRKRMKAELTDGAPPGTIFACNDSGWMKLDLFKQWFQHFLNFTKPSADDPVLLILDGHLSHTKNLDVILKARESFVTLFCLPPHTTHKLQPLDVGVMFPLSAYLDQALEKWINHHPGRTVTTFQISKIFCEAYLKASTPTNAINGFRRTGIVPMDPEIFTEADFIASECTDEPLIESNEQSSENLEISVEMREQEPIPGPSSCPDFVLLPDSNKSELSSSFANLTPSVCHPLPKLTKKRSARKRKSSGAIILTSTPYKNALETEKAAKLEAEIKKKERKEKRLMKSRTVKSKERKKKQTKKETPEDTESYDDDDDDDASCLLCAETFKCSASKEGWVRCSKCLKWAHDQCAGISDDEDDYVCYFCMFEARTSTSKKIIKF